MAAASSTATWPFLCSSNSFSISVVSLVNFPSYKSQISFSFPKTPPHPLFLHCLKKAEDSPFLLITEKTKIQIISSLKSLHFYFNELLAHLFLSIRESSMLKLKGKLFFTTFSLISVFIMPQPQIPSHSSLDNPGLCHQHLDCRRSPVSLTVIHRAIGAHCHL